ncbi:MAG: hypothetical protein WBA12_06110 [Catalinimonas sp.]
MKKNILIYVAGALASLTLLAACGVNKSQYETRKGKKKMQHYNSMQYQ